MKILAISGSLRKESLNTKLTHAFKVLAPSNMEVEIAGIGNLPLYNQDLDSALPESVQAFKTKIEAADALIIVTPEYNRSIPGVLKNAVDWGSRPYGKNSWENKPILVAGVSVGKIGTAPAQLHLRSILLYLNADVLGQPEIYIGPAKDIFAEDGTLIEESTKAMLSKGLEVLASHITKNN